MFNRRFVIFALGFMAFTCWTHPAAVAKLGEWQAPSVLFWTGNLWFQAGDVFAIWFVVMLAQSAWASAARLRFRRRSRVIGQGGSEQSIAELGWPRTPKTGRDEPVRGRIASQE